MLYLMLHMLSVSVNTSALDFYPGLVSQAAEFPQHLARLRKERNLTQQALAAKIGVHVVQLRRYESGTSQPTLDVIRRIAMTLGVSADLLLFGKDERGPDDDLRLQFEAVSRFDPEEKKIIRSLLDGMILKHEARRWSAEKGG
jgi:transcriptional regulator with XRE-family HTH domain